MPASERESLATLGRLVGQALAAVDSDGVLEPETFANVIVHELANPLMVAQASLEQAQETDDPEWIEKREVGR